MNRLLLTGLTAAMMSTAASAQQNYDQFLLPQPDQPFDGKVETRIGTLEFSN